MLWDEIASVTLSHPVNNGESSLNSSNRMLPSVVQAPKLELKQLPEQLKYAYHGEEETLSVIIAKDLISLQEEQLVNVLKKHKFAIGWTLADIRGNSPTVCMHQVALEDGSKPCHQLLRHLNPTLREVVMKVIFKLHEADIIYPIPNSE